MITNPSSQTNPLHPIYYTLQSLLTPHSSLVTPLSLFILALIPRVIGLDRFLTSDENTNIFHAGSDVIAAFLRGDLRGTYWHFYPGITMSWLDALGMGGQYLLGIFSGAALPPFSEYVYGDILSLLVANRLPYAVLTAAAVPVFYLLARKLMPPSVALLGAIFFAFDPFYLAHSRVAHGDAPVAVFMSLSALCFFIYGKQTLLTRHIMPCGYSSLLTPYLIASAILGSLAALTKAPGQFMALFIMGMSVFYAIIQIQQSGKSESPIAPNHSSLITHRSSLRLRSGQARIKLHWLLVILTWGIISLVVFILLWPSMWVDPVGTFYQMWSETFGKVEEGHLVYFFGQPTLDPGFWFYPYVIPFRLTPVVAVGALLSLLFFIPKVKSLIAHDQSPTLRLRSGQVSNLQSLNLPSPLVLLWLFTISLLIFGNLSPKKQDRYLLLLFPFLNLIAAIGWTGAISIINYQLSIIKSKAPTSNLQSLISNLQSPISNLPILLILFLHILPTFTYYPYYLAYFNPLMGGPQRAAQTTLMGWGEGLEQAAAYLNTKPNAEKLYVASTPSQTLLPYFAGTGENFYTNDIAFRADYVVLYLAQMQRLAPSPEIIRYFESQEPEKVITIHNVPYAKIYPGPKFILSHIPANATPINIGLENIIRLAGYNIQNSTFKTQNSKLMLYWHALAPIVENYTISVRARAADGRLLTQQDRWPVEGLLPTGQWRQGDYVADSYTLELSPQEASEISEFEIVVYNARTGQTLGPAITISNE